MYSTNRKWDIPSFRLKKFIFAIFSKPAQLETLTTFVKKFVLIFFFIQSLKDSLLNKFSVFTVFLYNFLYGFYLKLKFYLLSNALQFLLSKFVIVMYYMFYLYYIFGIYSPLSLHSDISERAD